MIGDDDMPPAPEPRRGKIGGARKGSGRKRNTLPPEIVKRLGKPPWKKPAKISSWYTGLLSELVYLYVTTGTHVDMLREVKAAAGSVGRLLPYDIVFAAQKALHDDEGEMNADSGPDEVDVEPSAAPPRKAVRARG